MLTSGCGPVAASARRLAAKLRNDSRGVAAVEFAMIVPVMFFLFVGSIEFSQALTVDRRVTQSASATADLIARAPAEGLTIAEVDGHLRIINELIKPYDLAPLTIEIFSVIARDAGGGAVIYRSDWSRNNRAGTPLAANAVYPNTAEVAGLLVAGESVIISRAVYNYTPLIFSYFIQSAFNLEEKFFLKPRNASCVHLRPVNCVTGGAI